jgi:hypothetical protein
MKPQKKQSLADWKIIGNRARIAASVCQKYGISFQQLDNASPHPIAPPCRMVNAGMTDAQQAQWDSEGANLSAAFSEYVQRCKDAHYISSHQAKPKTEKAIGKTAVRDCTTCNSFIHGQCGHGANFGARCIAEEKYKFWKKQK